MAFLMGSGSLSQSFFQPTNVWMVLLISSKSVSCRALVHLRFLLCRSYVESYIDKVCDDQQRYLELVEAGHDGMVYKMARRFTDVKGWVPDTCVPFAIKDVAADSAEGKLVQEAENAGPHSLKQFECSMNFGRHGTAPMNDCSKI